MRLNIRPVRHVQWDHLLLWIATFCVTSFAMLEHMSISIPAFSSLKILILYAGALCILPQALRLINIVFDRDYLPTFLLAIGFAALILFSMLANVPPRLGTSPVHHSLRLILYLIELFATMILIAESGRGKWLVRFLFRYATVLLIFTDILLLTRIVTFADGRHEAYLNGTKFSVIYLHMFWIALWFTYRSIERKTTRLPILQIAGAVVFMVIIALRVDCMTGIIGCLSLSALFVWIGSGKFDVRRRLTSPLTMLALLVLSALFPIVVEYLVNIPLIQFLVEDVLGRSLTLTGRVGIYEAYMRFYHEFAAWGFGYGNANIVSEMLFHAANPQNALLQWIFQIGTVPSCVFALLMIMIQKDYSRSHAENTPYLLPLSALIYAYIIMGTVETTYNMSYFLWFGVLFALANERTPDKVIHVRGLIAIFLGKIFGKMMK